MQDNDGTLQASLARHLETTPDRRALAFYKSGKTEWATYQELMKGAAGAALQLAEAGLSSGDCCVLVAGNDRVTVDALLGALLMGAVPLLVAPPVIQGANSSLPEILQGIINRTKPPVVVTTDRMRPEGDQLRSTHPDVRFFMGRDDLPASTAATEIELSGPDSVAAMQLTSGTTGFPRICVWRQSAVMAAFDGMAAAMGVGPDDTYVNWTPLYHDMGLMNNFLLCLTRGIPLVMLSPFDFVKDPSVWLRCLHETQATTTWSPNFGYALAAQRITDKKLDGIRLDQVRGFWNAAEKIHLDTIIAFQERLAPYGLDPAALKTNFGCAENIGGATFTRPGEGYRTERVDAAALHQQQVAQSAEDDFAGPTLSFVGCGVPHPTMSLQILDTDDTPLPDGRIGELALDTPSAMEGYLGNQEATAEAFVGKLLKTGDMGYVRDGEFFWTGRSRERITVRGRKLDPSDFEAPLLQIPGLRAGAFAAFGIDDPETGTQKVVLVAEVRDEGVDPEPIRSAARLNVFERLGLGLDDLVLVEKGTLTKTSSGKRRHRHFREMYLRGDLAQFEIKVDG